MKHWSLTTMAFAPFLAAASCQTPSVTKPADVLVCMEPAPATNSFIVANDRRFAVAVARHRGRTAKYGCS